MNPETEITPETLSPLNDSLLTPTPLNPTPTPNVVVGTPRPLAIPMAMPEKFNGSRALYRGFINQLNLVFMVNKTTYSTDSIKIAVLASYLTGPALAWFNPYLENQAAHEFSLSSYENFCLEMDAFFLPVDRTAMAALKLNELTMKPGQSVSEFASLFLQLSADVDWNEPALMNRFELGLTPAVGDMMVMHDYPPSLREMIALAIKLDGRLRLHQQQRNQRKQPTREPFRAQDHFAPRPSASRLNLPSPAPAFSDSMELDAATVRRGPLSQNERDERMRKGLCIVCGKEGHLKLNCPLRRNIAGLEVFP
jgi:hypothetical protein